MSKVGKKIIVIPSNVSISFTSNLVTITGLLGSFMYTVRLDLSIFFFCNFLSIFFLKSNNKFFRRNRSCLGTIQSILANAVIGVCTGFKKRLLLNGVGYKAFVNNNILTLRVGHSHKVECLIPFTLKVTVDNFTTISIFGIDKQIVGQFAAVIINFKPSDSYKGKGVCYEGVSLKLKEIKKK